MLESYDDVKAALVVTISWSMWCNRNEVQHGVIRKSSEALVQRATEYLGNYSVATCSTLVILEELNSNWTPPSSALFKINVDGAISKHHGSMGVGVVI